MIDDVFVRTRCEKNQVSNENKHSYVAIKLHRMGGYLLNKNIIRVTLMSNDFFACER